ncbi:putative citrate synthase [Cercophora samala]|uniref:Citrate synthase n=1 Tax=Cercophora samala TaxID=330535 RepID=A0AA39ZG32_9PEZI|nr:putative citrate synthase [Cercophora samala]
MPSKETGQLRIVDSRTENAYLIPIHDNFIRAKDLMAITTPDPRGSEVDQKLTILDNGFENVACMESEITLIDGNRGQIQYRGHPIQELFHNNDYEDVLYLLMWGKLPTQAEKVDVRRKFAAAMVPTKTVVDTIAAFPRNSDTYPMCLAGLCAFMSGDKVIANNRHTHKPSFHNNFEQADAAIIRTIAYYATTLALIHCHKRKLTFTNPDPNGTLIGNLLLMMGKTNKETGVGPDPEIQACLEKLWICYADHEMTNSTAGLLHAGSTLADPGSCAISALVCGFGPLHGGAIDLAYEALGKIKHPSFVPAYIEMVKSKKARLFGYGHRIYRTRDPRLSLIEELIEQNREKCDANPLLRVAFAIDKLANEDEYFVSRKLKANADLLGCFLYSALGFETDMITAIITLSRIPGGLAHWRETLDKPIKIWRPRQIYTGDRVDDVDTPRRQSLSSNEGPLKEKHGIQVRELNSGKSNKIPFKVKAVLWAKSCFS